MLQTSTLTVVAKDNGTPQLSSTSTVTIMVVSSQSELYPQWQPISSTPIDDFGPVQVAEDTAQSTILDQIYRATGSSGAKPIYLLYQGAIPALNSKSQFTHWTNDSVDYMKVQVVRPLDYEDTPNYVLTLRASVSIFKSGLTLLQSNTIQ